VNKPHVTEGIGFIEYAFVEEGIRVVAEQFSDDGVTELSFYSVNGSEELLLYMSKVNLLSVQTMNALTLRMEKHCPDPPWADMLTFIQGKTMQIARRGSPAVPVGKRPPSMRLEYQLEPILEKNQPTTIYGPGGHAKSLLAAYIACLVQFNIIGMANSNSCWRPATGNVLYLDWESSQEDFNRRIWAIKQGLGISTENTLLYRFCSQPLVNDIREIQRMVYGNNIDFIIADSQMAAAGYGSDPSQVSSQYYNALRSLERTNLTIDHVSKAEWSKINGSNSQGPYGSVVKFNRSRSQFEIKKSQDTDDNSLEIAMVHRKHNEGKLLKPIGIRISFHYKLKDELDKVTFSPCDIVDNPELSNSASARDRIVQVLRHGKLEVKAISDQLQIPEPTIRARLNDNKQLFKHFEDGWGLLI
jgi:hypothetical protein